MVPVAKSWAEIGDRFGVDMAGVPETRADVESGAARFARLPDDRQREILGPSRYEAYKAGRVTLDAHPDTGVVARKLSAEWGSTRHTRPLRDVVGAEDAKGFRAAAAARQKALRESKASLAEAEEAIRDLPKEEVYVFDASGKRIGHARGTKTRVSLPPGVTLKGATVTHNHPSGSSFSRVDMRTASRCEVGELRAVGSQYTHSMKPPPEGWPPWQTIWDAYAKHDADVIRGNRERIRLGRQASPRSDQLHEVWRRVASELGLRYSRTEVSRGR